MFAAIGLRVSTAAVDSELTVTPGLRHAVQLKWTAIVHEAENTKYHIRFFRLRFKSKGRLMSEVVLWKPLWLLPSEKCRPEVHPS